MTTEQARFNYRVLSNTLRFHEAYCQLPLTDACHKWAACAVEAASLVLDLAEAVESEERLRRSVAW